MIPRMSSLHEMVAFLKKQIWFPEPRGYDRYLKEGLLAVGGDLSVRRLKPSQTFDSEG